MGAKAGGPSAQQELWRRRIAEAVAEHGQLIAVARRAEMGSAQLQKIVNGTTKDPGIGTVQRIARAMDLTLKELIEPRPGPGAGLDQQALGGTGSNSRLADRLGKYLEGAKDSTWQADVLEAITALTRALGRETTPAKTAEASGATGRGSDRHR